MLNFGKNKGPEPKFIATHGLLPSHVDTKQLPSARRPFSTILNQQWSHTVELVMPQELYDEAGQHFEKSLSEYHHIKLHMSLADVLRADFFNQYIKIGNVTMLSEGRSGHDNLYSLREGIMRIELPKDVYERAGLQGQPIADGGPFHKKSRYAIEINLRAPAMVHGRKGFDRIVYAAEHVLDKTITWLFVDHNAKEAMDTESKPYTPYSPDIRHFHPQTSTRENILIPPLAPPSSPDIDHEDALDLLEWLDLVSLDSPRVSQGDTIDPFLSRYQPPQTSSARPGTLVVMRWQGFLLGDMLRHLFSQCITLAQKDKGYWIAMSAKKFRSEGMSDQDGYAVVCFPEGAEDGLAWKEAACKGLRTRPAEFLSLEMAGCVEGR